MAPIKGPPVRDSTMEDSKGLPGGSSLSKQWDTQRGASCETPPPSPPLFVSACPSSGHGVFWVGLWVPGGAPLEGGGGYYQGLRALSGPESDY